MTESTVLSRLDARIPRWDARSLRKRDCPFCGSTGWEKYIRPDGLRVRSCDKCGTFFVSPAPDENSLNSFYRHYYAGHSRSVQPDPNALLASESFSDFRILEISTYVNLFGSRVLDVGCGWGDSLIKFRKEGADVYGLDLDAEAVQFVRDRLGIPNISLGNIENYRDKRPFDVITMFDFIEHPLCPMTALRSTVSLLKPNGILAIWTPNASFALDEVNPILLRVDFEHMQYLCLQTCDFLSKTLGCRIVHLETCGSPFLTDIDKPCQQGKKNLPVEDRIKGFVRALPGFRTANAIRLFLRRTDNPNKIESRFGHYHLFCIFLKSE